MSSLTNSVEVKPLDRFSWVDFINLKVPESQKDFVPSVLHSIAESKFDDCTPMGIWYRGKPVGFIMYCNFNRLCWVNRVIVDAQFQRKGIGRDAVNQVVDLLQKSNCHEIRTSVALENQAALSLFKACGFILFGQDSTEYFLRYEG